jgi:type II secretory ATPase GspE/PulE/Tfp pilus assembly ATPase PilB-like protein
VAVHSDSGITVLVRLDASDVERLGLGERVARDTIEAIRQVLGASHGLVMVGASSSIDRRQLLRSVLAEADLPARSVVAIEDAEDDPITGTTRLLGESQAALRAALALDPDIVVISRPHDSALNARAVELALGNRLVLITSDAPDPGSALDRMRAVADPFLVSAALTLIVTATPHVSEAEETNGVAERQGGGRSTALHLSTIEVVVVTESLRDAIWHDTQRTSMTDASIRGPRR